MLDAQLRDLLLFALAFLGIVHVVGRLHEERVWMARVIGNQPLGPVNWPRVGALFAVLTFSGLCWAGVYYLVSNWF